MFQYIIILLLFFFCQFYWVFASGNVENMSVKDLSQNIEKLKEKEQNYQDNIRVLAKEHGELVSFFSSKITSENIDEIRQQIEDFKKEQTDLDNQIKQAIQKGEDPQSLKDNFLEEQIEFYEYLSQFVDDDKKDDYVDYIWFHVQASKERKDLIVEILANEEAFNQKVNYYKDKIATHKEELQNRIEQTILTKIAQKIHDIDTNEKYKDIPLETKNALYQDFINKIEARIVELENSNMAINYVQMRKNILQKMIQEIQKKQQQM